MIQRGHLEKSISLSLKTYQTFKPCPVEKYNIMYQGVTTLKRFHDKVAKIVKYSVLPLLLLHLFACMSQVLIIAGRHHRFLLETSATALSRHRHIGHTEMNEVAMLSFSHSVDVCLDFCSLQYFRKTAATASIQQLQYLDNCSFDVTFTSCFKHQRRLHFKHQ